MSAWGNLLTKSVSKCGGENLSVTAGPNNQLLGAYTYDAAGNMLHDATSNLNYTYDQENRITGAAGYTYTYDGDGNRVKKSNGSTGTLYWYLSPGIVAESDLSGNLQSEYVFFDGERVAREDFPSGTVSYYFSDHLKTASVVTDASGNIKEDEDYYPWGGELQFVNNDSNHYKFTGKERDSETQLDYFGARYYSNGLGRFITPDWAAKATAVPYAEFADPQSLNLYTYVRNVPTTRFDPDGHDPEYDVLFAGLSLVTDWLGKQLSSLGQGAASGPTMPHIPSAMPPPANCPTPSNQQNDSKQNDNNSYQKNTKDQLKENAAKGKAGEKNVLQEKGVPKNTQKVTASEGNSIPDELNDKKIGEIKNAKTVSNTRQLRIQKEAATTSGREHELTTGDKTHVTDNAKKGTTVTRRPDLGPK